MLLIYFLFVAFSCVYMCLIFFLFYFGYWDTAPVHQMQQYYRLGVLDNCSGKWTALVDCLTLKTKRSTEIQVGCFLLPFLGSSAGYNYE